ncbi:hypothetical protein HDU91_004897 [Kappamyces sp. JEL0680]|nr:hypothetical protein HDU91_004897 [Kappamyces sp. JEL0680]
MASLWGFTRNKGKDPKNISVVVQSDVGIRTTKTALRAADQDAEKQKKLMELCKDGSLETARAFCAKHPQLICNSINSPIDNNGNVPLHLTVSQNDHMMTCILLLKGGDPNIANKSGVTPIMIANRMGFSKIVDVLLMCGAIASSKPSLASPHSAAYFKSQLNTEELEASDRIAVITKDRRKESSVSPNPTQGLFGSFRQKSGRLPEAIDEEGKTIVQAAMETGVMILPDAAYLGFQTQLISVIRRDTLQDADEEGSTILMKAAYAGHVSLVKDLLDLGCDADAMDKYGNTALVWAVLGGKIKMVKLLNENGANIDGAVPYCKKSGTVIRGQMTPLIAACYHGRNSIVSYLIKEGCDVNLRCGYGKGRSAIMIAAWSRRKETVQTLISNRAFVDPDVDSWLTKGIMYMKKTVSEKNAWIGVNLESVLQRRDQNSRNDLSLITSSSRRQSIQDKFVFFTTEESNLVGDIHSLLTSRAGVDVKDVKDLATPQSAALQLLPPALEPQGSASSLKRMSTNRKRNTEFRQGLNLDKIMGVHSEAVISLAEQMPDHGTELDGLWIKVFQCIVQLLMAANKNIKHHYIAIAAKTNHCAAEIVRAIEQTDRKIQSHSSRSEAFCDTLVRSKIREWCKIISNDYPKQLIVSTRMAIGVWPPPDAVTEMIREAASLASACRELVLLANTLGSFAISETKFDVSFQAFEETQSEADSAGESVADKDISLKGGLSYSEYKRQNDLKMLEEMSKNMGSVVVEETKNEEEEAIDGEFFSQLDILLKQFVSAATELKQVHQQHLVEEFINVTSKVYTRADNIMEEVLNFELLRDFADDIVITQADVERIAASGVKLSVSEYPALLKPIFKQAFENVKTSAKLVMAKGVVASNMTTNPTAATEMLHSSIPCLIAVKKLVVITKEAVVRVRHTGAEERRKRDAWRKECLANDRVKQLFHMWESQVLGDSKPANKKNVNQLTAEEIELLQDSTEGLVFEEVSGVKKLKGGKLQKLVEYATSHTPLNEDDFTAIFLMTHHSFTTSISLMDMLIKRYAIAPPHGLGQRMFDIFVDKKVIQVRLKVCHAFLFWIQNHFEEDFADNEMLVLRFRDFITTKVMFDFDQMAIQILDTLERKLAETETPRTVVSTSLEKPKPMIIPLRFGTDPLNNLLTDNRAFFDLDPLELARQLTLIEHDLYTRFKSYECLDQIWESNLKKEVASYKQTKPLQPKRHAPGSSASDVSRMIRHTNEFTFWVATCVVNNGKLKTRVNSIKYFVTMAQHCREMNNLTAVTTIVAGLSMGPVSRLHKTWESFGEKNPKLAESYRELQDLVSPKMQYSTYRKCLKEMALPALPFLGVFLTDLTFLDLGNPDFLPESHFINFEKRRKVYQLIREIQKYQQVPYDFQAVPQIQEFMKKLGEPKGQTVGWEESSPIMTEDELYAKSNEVEAKEESSDEDE